MNKWLNEKLNNSQRQILSSWRPLFIKYLKSEWTTAVLGYSWGALLAALGHYLLHDAYWLHGGLPTHDRQVYIRLLPEYLPYVWLIAGPLLLLFSFRLVDFLWRVLTSWAQGVTAGSFFLPLFAAAILFSTTPQPFARAGIAAALTAATLFVGFGLRLRRAIVNERTLDIASMTVRPTPSASYVARDAEAPIDQDNEDKLDRAAFVEMLTFRILVSKTPVVALRGPFGEGKSSVLNLLRRRLECHAIVVSFSTWLPDSPTALASALFADISIAVSKHVIVPGFRRRLDKFATMLTAVPYLKPISALLPTHTQQQQMQDLAYLLERLPKRVVVLLDEIDRMQKEEVLMLLKVIRGSSSLPNVTFVCSFHQEQVEALVCGSFGPASHEFMEKFFPTAVDLPKSSSEQMKAFLIQQLFDYFKKEGWFTNQAEADAFIEGFGRLWDVGLSRLCTNLRKLSLVTNDIRAAAVLVQREVNAVDLCAIESLRRFHPRVYEVVWTEATFFSSSNDWWKSLRFMNDGDQEARKARINLTLKQLSASDDDSSTINGLLDFMFSKRMGELGGNTRRWASSREDIQDLEEMRRIAHPDYFPIYFHRTVPEAAIRLRTHGVADSRTRHGSQR